MLSTCETLQLIKEAKEGNDSAKEKLISENLPLIKSIVRRYKNKMVDYEDLIQLGTLGLIKAINNFNTEFGVKFSTYAVPMIAGEIKRFIRDDGAIKVSRSTKAQALEINKYVDEYRVKEGESPTIEHLGEKFNLEPSELVFILDSTRYPVSIYQEAEDDGLPLADKIATNENPEDELDKLILRDIIANLPERDKKIILLRYFRDKTQTQVAEELGVSQVQISRLEAKILQKMRENLKVD
ncbi:MAG: SigB/SigF/SigG family RNA polymerase sigma factor [Clostridia bacterium]|nr:SigB/SigF/SigG family RNA polymerase sigma factor [Clostridia bacterium]